MTKAWYFSLYFVEYHKYDTLDGCLPDNSRCCAPSNKFSLSEHTHLIFNHTRIPRLPTSAVATEVALQNEAPVISSTDNDDDAHNPIGLARS